MVFTILLAQVSYGDHVPSVVRRPSVNFSFKRLLLQNHWTNLNHIW